MLAPAPTTPLCRCRSCSSWCQVAADSTGLIRQRSHRSLLASSKPAAGSSHAAAASGPKRKSRFCLGDEFGGPSKKLSGPFHSQCQASGALYAASCAKVLCTVYTHTTYCGFCRCAKFKVASDPSGHYHFDKVSKATRAEKHHQPSQPATLPYLSDSPLVVSWTSDRKGQALAKPWLYTSKWAVAWPLVTPQDAEGGCPGRETSIAQELGPSYLCARTTATGLTIIICTPACV